MDEAIMIMRQQRLELEREQDAFIKLMKKVEQEEDWQYQSNLSSNHELEEYRELWYSDTRLEYCLGEIQEKQHILNNELSYLQERRKDYYKKQQLKWARQEEDIYKEYRKRLEKMNE